MLAALLLAATLTTAVEPTPQPPPRAEAATAATHLRADASLDKGRRNVWKALNALAALDVQARLDEARVRLACRRADKRAARFASRVVRTCHRRAVTADLARAFTAEAAALVQAIRAACANDGAAYTRALDAWLKARAAIDLYRAGDIYEHAQELPPGAREATDWRFPR